MTSIPTLETERLILRPPTMDDWPAYRDFMASDRAVFMGGPHNEEANWGMFCHDTALWSLFGHGALSVDTRTDRACVGQIGINAGPLFPERELGWFVFPGSEGKGYAFEAASALRDWALGVRGFKTLVSNIHPDNARSIRLAERLGASPDPDAPRRDPKDLIYRHPGPVG